MSVSFNKAHLYRLTFLLSGLLLSSFTGLAYAQDMPSQSELDQINSTIAQVQIRIQQTNSERSNVQSQLQDIEKAASQINTDLNNLSTEIDREQIKLRQLRADTNELEASKTEQQTLISQYMRSAYQNGQEEYLKLLLNQQNIDQITRSLRYYQYFNQARADKVNNYKQTITELAALQKEIQTSNLVLEDKRTQLSQQQQALTSTQTERQAILDELDSVLNQSGAELANLEQEREEMALLIKELSRTIVNLSLGTQDQAFADLKGQLPWPVTGRLLNSYGESYDFGDLDWQGVTIAGNEGEPVQAIHHGRVIFADWFANSGLLLIIDHGDGYMTLYAHNQLLYKSVGDWVNSGEVITAIGNTGGRKEHGVYFEVRQNGDSVDPISWLAARNN